MVGCRFLRSDRSLRDGVELWGCRFLRSDRSLRDGMDLYIYTTTFWSIPTAWKSRWGVVFYVAIDPFGMVWNCGGVVFYVAIDPFGMVWNCGGVVFYVAIDPFGMVWNCIYIPPHFGPYLRHGNQGGASFST